ncbi:hypothetical protein GKR41_00251 [Candidatus Vallotia lariciata]|nr:hypothetical protein GKR41_00251 [Candidatus Vallotia lariciata]
MHWVDLKKIKNRSHIIDIFFYFSVENNLPAPVLSRPVVQLIILSVSEKQRINLFWLYTAHEILIRPNWAH